MPLLLLAYLGFVSVGLPEGMLGVAWPQLQVEFGAPVGAVGFLLFTGTAGYVLASVAAGFTMGRLGVGWLLAASTALSAAALVGYGLAPALVVVVVAALFHGFGSGAIDAGLNAYVARHYGARHISWLHASFGFGATVGPLVMTGVLGAGLVWRWGYGVLAVALTLLATAFLVTARAWSNHAQATTVPTAPSTTASASEVPPLDHAATGPSPVPVLTPPSRHTLLLPGLWLGAAAFVVQVAIEIGAGLWGYTLLTAGRGMPEHLAGLAVSAYWGSMFVGRLLSGAVTDRIGTHRVLTAGVAGMTAGAVLIAVPAPGWLAVAGLVLVGFAAAPMFPLLILTTTERVGQAHADRSIGVQVGASALGGTLVPAGIGVLIGRIGPEVLGPSLVVLGGALAVVYAWSRRPPVNPAAAARPL